MEAALARVQRTHGPEIGWREYGAGMQGREMAAEPRLWGDAVLSRKDIPASYHIAVVVDDALQGVTDVVRGEDLFMATGLHRLLQILLDLPAPCYHHHELLRDAAGRKLSKSLQSQILADIAARRLDARRRQRAIRPRAAQFRFHPPLITASSGAPRFGP